jgi:nitroreductase
MGDNFNPTVYNNLMHQGDKASHIIVAVMKRGDLAKIPPFEEIAAVSCSIQNMLLSATALNIASFWSTGGMAQKTVLKEFLGFGEEDLVMGILYFGYADEYPAGQRNTKIEEKITWVK